MTSDFVYKQVLNGCLKEGVSQTQARNAAMVASENYSKGRYKGKVADMIVSAIKAAKKVSYERNQSNSANATGLGRAG